MKVLCPYPHKHLWPNGPRSNFHAVNREKQKHRQWAHFAALEALQSEGSGGIGGEAIPVTIHVHAKPKGPLPDKDNCVAAAKSLLDGIADALSLNDSRFAAPLVVFDKPRTGHFLIEVGHG